MVKRRVAIITSRCAREDCKRNALPGVQIWNFLLQFKALRKFFLPRFLMAGSAWEGGAKRSIWEAVHKAAYRASAGYELGQE